MRLAERGILLFSSINDQAKVQTNVDLLAKSRAGVAESIGVLRPLLISEDAKFDGSNRDRRRGICADSVYRMGVFEGERDADARNSLRTAGYVQYDFFSTETGYSFLGTALGQKKILAVDGGFDKQGQYRSWSGNVASDTPVRHGDEVGVNFQYLHYDGEKMFLTIPDQNDLLLELAYYIHRVKFQPFAAVSSQNFGAAGSESKDLERYGSGANYYIRGQHLKWTLQYNRVVPRNSTAKPGNEMTMQLQLFYF